jgi:hypothetical protein
MYICEIDFSFTIYEKSQLGDAEKRCDEMRRRNERLLDAVEVNVCCNVEREWLDLISYLFARVVRELIKLHCKRHVF